MKFFQDNPEILPTHHFHFLKWCGVNGDMIVDFMKQKFQPEREFFAAYIKENRQIDTAATLMLTARVLLRYAQAISSPLSGSGIDSVQADWRNALIALLCHSEEQSQERDPAQMFCAALFGLVSAGRITIARDQASFKPGQHIGFEKEGCWWLLPHEIHNQISRYWKEAEVKFPFKEEKTRIELAQKELIETARENRNGKPKMLYVLKSTLEGRPRMLVLRVEQARDYVEQLI